MEIINGPTEARKCSRCGEVKPLDDFYVSMNRGKPHRMRKCKRCHGEAAIQWRKRNPEQASRAEARHAPRKALRRIEREYGITPDVYRAMQVSQQGRCAICARQVPLDVDHCHNSGDVRGLLCRNCNRAIGWMKDDPKLLIRAAVYLTKAKEASWPRSA